MLLWLWLEDTSENASDRARELIQRRHAQPVSRDGLGTSTSISLAVLLLRPVRSLLPILILTLHVMWPREVTFYKAPSLQRTGYMTNLGRMIHLARYHATSAACSTLLEALPCTDMRRTGKRPHFSSRRMSPILSQHSSKGSIGISMHLRLIFSEYYVRINLLRIPYLLTQRFRDALCFSVQLEGDSITTFSSLSSGGRKFKPVRGAVIYQVISIELALTL